MHSSGEQKSFSRFFYQVPIHPLLFAAYPVLSLLAYNLGQINPGDGLLPLLVAVAAAAVLLGLLRLVSRSWPVAGLLTTLLAVWFFVYGHLYNVVKNASLLGMTIGRHRYLLLVWSVIVLAAAFWLVKKYRASPNLTFTLNVVSLVLVLVSTIQIGAYYMKDLAPKPAAGKAQPLIAWTGAGQPPDVYYIVLDGYPRSDVLKQEMGIDNSDFINGLQKMGFYVADCAQSNYTRTVLSLHSTFNMEYLQTLYPNLTPDMKVFPSSPDPNANLVRQQLEALGYKTVVFNNPWENLVWNDATIVYRARNSSLLSPFVYLTLSTTATRVYLDEHQAQILSNLNTTPYYSNYIDTRYALEQLPKVPSIPGRKLVFVHLIIPHVPYVFGPDGEYLDIRPYDTVNHLYTPEDTLRGETAAIAFIDKQMLEILPRLIQASPTPPIIVVAGDHGTGPSKVVTRNLEAIYTPGFKSPFYSTVTPVNIFRILFNTYFDGKFDLLPDKSYYSAGGKYFNFQEMPNPCSQP